MYLQDWISMGRNFKDFKKRYKCNWNQLTNSIFIGGKTNIRIMSFIKKFGLKNEKFINYFKFFKKTTLFLWKFKS